MIKVVHCKKEKNHIYIGRPSILENPFKLEKGMKKGSTIPLYKKYFYKQIENKNLFFMEELDKLIELAKKQDINLGCWCAPKACHGDVVKEYIENQLNR